MFMHGGLMHFASNMWYLWIFGDNVEGALGKIKFVLFYIAAGLFASLAQYLLVIDSSIPNLGASGAIAGVLGFYLVNFNKSTVKTLIPYPYLTVTELPSTFILTTWFLLQLLSGAASLPFSGDSGGVAWWAHIGGFVFGYLVGQVYKRTRRIQEVTPFERFVRF
jgi:membrane associated rhomboid family serine protease